MTLDFEMSRVSPMWLLSSVKRVLSTVSSDLEMYCVPPSCLLYLIRLVLSTVALALAAMFGQTSSPDNESMTLDLGISRVSPTWLLF